MTKYFCYITFISEIFLIQHLSRTGRRSLCQLRFCRRRAGVRLFLFTSSLFQIKIRYDSHIFFLQNVKEKKLPWAFSATAGTYPFLAHFFYDKCNFLGQQTWLFGAEHFHNQSTAVTFKQLYKNTLKGEHLKC